MKDEIDRMLKLLPQLTKEEADLIEQTCKLTDVERAAYMMAKHIFEDKEE